jgi:hypothetical protein
MVSPSPVIDEGELNGSSVLFDYSGFDELSFHNPLGGSKWLF